MDEVCAIPEVQFFHCTADGGSLALSWNGHSISGIDVSTDQEELKRLLETIPGRSSNVVILIFSLPLFLFLLLKCNICNPNIKGSFLEEGGG